MRSVNQRVRTSAQNGSLRTFTDELKFIKGKTKRSLPHEDKKHTLDNKKKKQRPSSVRKQII